MPLILSGTAGVSGVDGSAGTPSYQGTDTNTGIFYPAADTIALSTSGAERLRVDSSGNVSQATGSYFLGNGGGFGWGDLTTYIGGTSASDFINFHTNGSERMRIDSSGNVGIGTSSPSATLDVRNTSNEQIRFGYTGTPNYCSLGRNSGTGNFNIFVNSAEPLLFGTNNTERMRITSGGALLIGRSSATGNEVLNSRGVAVLSMTGTSQSGMVNIPTKVYFGKTTGPATTSTATVTVTANMENFSSWEQGLIKVYATHVNAFSGGTGAYEALVTYQAAPQTALAPRNFTTLSSATTGTTITVTFTGTSATQLTVSASCTDASVPGSVPNHEVILWCEFISPWNWTSIS